MPSADAIPLRPRARRSRAAFTITALLLIGTGVALLVGALGFEEVWNQPADNLHLLGKYPPIQNPVALAPTSVCLADDAKIIGVSREGRHRAYVLNALGEINRHVVNDFFGGAPITVSCCPRTGCVLVFTQPGGRQPLDVTVGGFYGEYEEGRMLLRVGSALYLHEAGLTPVKDANTPFPYFKTDFVQTTWKEWREAHPDTDVYVGELPLAPPKARVP